MEKHTAGPWRKCGGTTPHYMAIVDGRGRYIVHEMADDLVDDVEAPSIEEQEANARLIAAAPDLYKVVEELCSCKRAGVGKALQEAGHAALAKAKGTP